MTSLHIRRDLTKELPALKNAECLLTLSLMKSFAKKPAYWIEIYKYPDVNATEMFCIALQWSFSREGKPVTGQVAKRSRASLHRTCDLLFDDTVKKLDDSWLVSGPALVHTSDQREQRAISNILHQLGKWVSNRNLGFSVEIDTDVEMNVSAPSRALSRAEKFEQAEKRRRAKAEW